MELFTRGPVSPRVRFLFETPTVDMELIITRWVELCSSPHDGHGTLHHGDLAGRVPDFHCQVRRHR